MPPRTPTPEMIAAGVAALRHSTRAADAEVTATWQAMWDAACDKPVWVSSPAGRVWLRSDGATVRYVETKTGKRPWRGSHWHNGRWVLNASTANWESAEGGMSAINYHWPNAMNPTEGKDA